jgi:hypothetical protein
MLPPAALVRNRRPRAEQTPQSSRCQATIRCCSTEVEAAEVTRSSCSRGYGRSKLPHAGREQSLRPFVHLVLDERAERQRSEALGLYRRVVNEDVATVVARDESIRFGSLNDFTLPTCISSYSLPAWIRYRPWPRADADRTPISPSVPRFAAAVARCAPGGRAAAFVARESAFSATGVVLQNSRGARFACGRAVARTHCHRALGGVYDGAQELHA